MRSGKYGICKLCGNNSVLRHSHIIPKSCLKPLRSQENGRMQGRFYSLSSRSDEVYSTQDGWKEYLLCENCETTISKYEDYFSNFWQNGSLLQKENAEGYCIVYDIDYNAFKLFFLSVFWRMSVSSLEACRNVALGPYEDDFRNMILEGRAPGERTFPIMGIRSTYDNEIVISPLPGRWKETGKRFYSCTFAGVEWTIYIDNLIDDRTLPIDYLLRENGTLFLSMKSDHFQQDTQLMNAASKNGVEEWKIVSRKRKSS